MLNLKKRLSEVPPVFRNRYLLAVLAFFIWLLLFDRNDLITQLKLKRNYHKILKEKEYYNAQIVVIESELENLLNDEEKLEKFAREKYLMRKPGEELFVIVFED